MNLVKSREVVLGYPHVSRGWVHIPETDLSPRRLTCAGCKKRIGLMKEFLKVVTRKGGLHFWHPICYDRKPRPRSTA